MKTTSLCLLLALAAPVMLLADAAAVPELDPASASSVVAILMGSGLMLRDRLRRR